VGILAPAITSKVRPKKRVTIVFGDVLLVNGLVSRTDYTLPPICN